VLLVLHSASAFSYFLARNDNDNETRELASLAKTRQQARKGALAGGRTIKTQKGQFAQTKTLYAGERDNNILVRRDRVLQMTNELEACDGQTTGSSNNNRCNQLKHQMRQKIPEVADELRHLTTELAGLYVVKSQHLIKELQKEIKRLDGESAKIKEFQQQTKYNARDFRNENKMIKEQKQAANKVLGELRHFKTDLEKIIFGTMCFDVIGATSKINTPKELEEFQELTRNAVEIACGELGIDADLMLMKIIKQQYIPSSSKRRTQEVGNSPRDNLVEKDGENESNTHGLLRASEEHNRELNANRARTFTLRVGTLVGIFCRCEDESPMSDVWGRRRRLQKADDHEQGQQQNKDEIQEELEDKDKEDAFKTHVFQRDLRVHRDLLSMEDRKLSHASTFQKQYIDALHVAFQQGPLSGVVQVEQIQCEGFLSEEQALSFLQNLR